MRSVLYMILFLLCGATLSHAQMRCASNLNQESAASSDSNYLFYLRHETALWQQYAISAPPTGKVVIAGKDTAYEIPTVVHVIHTGGPVGSISNPAAKDIDSILNYVNRTFNAQWPLYPSASNGGQKVPIRFVLARRDPDCNPTTGIVRVDGRVLTDYVTNGVSSSYDQPYKSLSIWPTRDYYNIWIVNMIDGPFGLTGFAPLSADAKYDGTTIASYAIFYDSTVQDYPYALVHEIGHSLSLLHTFEGMDCNNTNCRINGDGICDTEPHTEMGCMSASDTNQCTQMPFGPVRNNFMNYTGWGCANQFTAEQKSRMMLYLNTVRLGLLNSNGAQAPDPTFLAPAPACIPHTIWGFGQNVGPHMVTLADMKTSSYGFFSDNDAGYLDRTCAQAPAHLVVGKSYTLTVSSGQQYQYNRAWIDYNNNGVFEKSEEVMKVDTLHGRWSTQTASFSVPAIGVVMQRPLRMRIISDYINTPKADTLAPCDSLLYGQAEDYSVIVSPAQSPGEVAQTAAKNSVHIFPNPACGTLNVSSAVPVSSVIYNAQGRVMANIGGRKSIDISSWPDGLYYLRSENSTVSGNSLFLKSCP